MVWDGKFTPFGKAHSIAGSLSHDRRFRVLVVVDDLTRECLAPVANNSLPGARVSRWTDDLNPIFRTV